MSGNNFNPSNLNLGNIVVTLNYTGVNNGNVSPDGGITPAFPGCIQIDTIQVVITAAVAPPVVSNITVCAGGNTNIVPTPIPGPTASNTFTWNFEGNITGLGISQNSMNVASNAPVQTVGSGLTGVAFQVAGSGCTGAITSSNYDVTKASLADAVADNEFFEFSVGTPNVGVVFNNVSAMNWNHRISGTGPMSFAVVASNNLTTPILTGNITGRLVVQQLVEHSAAHLLRAVTEFINGVPPILAEL